MFKNKNSLVTPGNTFSFTITDKDMVSAECMLIYTPSGKNYVLSVDADGNLDVAVDNDTMTSYQLQRFYAV
jgi:hypothetical protein